MNDPEYDRAVEELQKLYAELPALDCKGFCGFSCRQPILFSEAEEERITRYRGGLPMPAYQSRTCPLLENERCSVHPARPLVCRLWGMAVDLPPTLKMPPCPFGCVPERVLSLDEQRAFTERAYKIGGGLSAAQVARLRAIKAIE